MRIQDLETQTQIIGASDYIHCLKVMINFPAVEGAFCECQVSWPDPNSTVVICANCKKPIRQPTIGTGMDWYER